MDIAGMESNDANPSNDDAGPYGTSPLEDACSLLFTQQKLTTTSDHCAFPSLEQASHTHKWLSSNYELSDGYSLPKSLIYNHYLGFCQQRDFTPVNTACFGKVIRHAFPQLTTRRLGSRGQSKYHYYGVKVRTASVDIFGTSDAKQIGGPLSSGTTERPSPLMRSVQNREAFKQQQLAGVLQYPPQIGSALIWASSTLLPEFPDASDLKDTSQVSVGQVNYLITSYRSHCIQVLETVLRGGLSDVGFLIEHFWQHLNESFRSMLGHVCLTDTIAVCDTHLYHTVVAVLIPGAVQPLPSNLLRVIRNFACCYEEQVEKALRGLPQRIIDVKLSVAKQFVQMLHRKTTLAHLAQASRCILSTEGSLQQMRDDWEKRTEHDPVCAQVAWSSCDDWGMQKDFIINKLESYAKLLEDGHTVEDHIHWLEMLVKEKVDQIEKESEKIEALKSLILQWSYLSHLIVRDQTLRSAASFGSFHLLNLLYQEYLLYIMDIQCFQQQETSLWHKVIGQDSQVLQRFLTYPVMCDLEECILRDNPYMMDPNPQRGQTPQMTGIGNGSVGIQTVAKPVKTPPGNSVLKQKSQSYQNPSRNTPSSSCVLGQTSQTTSSRGSSAMKTPITPLPGTLPPSDRLLRTAPKADASDMESLVESNADLAIIHPTAMLTSDREIKEESESFATTGEVQATNEQSSNVTCDSELSTKVVKVIPIPKEEVGKAGDARKPGEAFFIKISIPRSDEMKVVRGQVLMTEDGRSFMIDEVTEGKWDENTHRKSSHGCAQS
ncbi:regulatory factor X 4-like isoform X2 [Apostichopus japonicus]|uniref:regulatory factor X 4-like isoform X2 n=1 Tax=Stichopus japonicus TaxID=307972 RepID=UPI003AB796CD